MFVFLLFAFHFSITTDSCGFVLIFFPLWVCTKFYYIEWLLLLQMKNQCPSWLQCFLLHECFVCDYLILSF